MKYYMRKGIGEERYISDEETWEKILAAAKKVQLYDDLGGNAAVMAQRGELEGCDVTLGAPMNQSLIDQYYRGNVIKKFFLMTYGKF